MSQQEIDLSLRIAHPTLDLSEVCAVLGLTPKVIWKNGDERQTPKGRKLGGLNSGSYCSIDFGTEAREALPKRIEAVLALLKPHRTLLRRVSSTGGALGFTVGWFCEEHTGESFSWQLLDAMADLRIGLDLHIYVPDSEAESETSEAVEGSSS